jgi:hypothetical protein
LPVDIREFVREAPVFYALAIAVGLSKGGDVISKSEIRQNFTVFADDNDPDGGISFLASEPLWNLAVDWLTKRGMVQVRKLAFGPAVYSRGAKFSERWQDLTSTNDGSVFGTYGVIRDGNSWLREALQGILETQEQLNITEADFVEAKKPRRIAEEMEPFTDPPTKFDGLTDDSAVDSITSWFFENFEDAAEGRGFDGTGAGIWGGPYRTRDVIENVFADTATDALIDAAVAEIRKEGDDWVPKTRGPNYIDEEPNRNPSELHAEMLRQVVSLERTLPEIFKVPHHGMGHNNPPEAMDAEPLDAADAKEIEAALATLKAQPVVPDKPEEAEKAAATIESKRSKVKAWLAKQGDEFVSAAVKEAGKEFGKWAPRALWLVVVDRMLGVSRAALAWISTFH